MSAAIYTRVSSFEQARDGYSLDAQKRTLEQYANAMNYNISGYYSDEGIPGKKMKNRPGLLKMLEDVRQGKISVVLIWKITRLGRNTMELLQMCDLFQKYDVRLISVTESFDTNTAMGKLFFCILSAFAEYENDIRGENVRAGLEERARQGKRSFSRAFGFDVKDGKVTINKNEQKQLLFFHELFQKHQNLYKCSKILSNNGYVGKKGAPISQVSLSCLLTSLPSVSINQIKKTGEMVHLTEVPSLIDFDVFMKTQKILIETAQTKTKQRKMEHYRKLKSFMKNKNKEEKERYQ